LQRTGGFSEKKTPLRGRKVKGPSSGKRRGDYSKRVQDNTTKGGRHAILGKIPFRGGRGRF